MRSLSDFLTPPLTRWRPTVYRRWAIIKENRRECSKAGHYLAIVLPHPFDMENDHFSLFRRKVNRFHARNQSGFKNILLWMREKTPVESDKSKTYSSVLKTVYRQWQVRMHGQYFHIWHCLAQRICAKDAWTLCHHLLNSIMHDLSPINWRHMNFWGLISCHRNIPINLHTTSPEKKAMKVVMDSTNNANWLHEILSNVHLLSQSGGHYK